MARNATITLCADDYGLSWGVSQGILEALRAGRLSAVSVLATSPRWPALGRDLLREGFDVDVGLHLNLTLGAPLGPMPQFAPGGKLPPVSRVIHASLRDKLPLGEIRAEIDRQLDRFEAVMERPPDFVDGHQHVQILPDIRDELLEALTERRLQGRCWLRDSGDRLHRILWRRSAIKKALFLRGVSRGFRREARRAGFAVNDGFAGFSPFHPGKDYAKQFATYLRARGRRHLIMCHPGHVDADLRAQDPVTVTREQELAFLLSPKFEEMLAKKRLTLGRMGKVVG
jgi:chitin disaccharide deacetylase